MKRVIKSFFVLCLIGCSCVFTCIYALSGTVSKNYKVTRGQELKIDSVVPITATYNGVKMSGSSISRHIGDSFKVDLKIFGVIPFSTADIQVVDNMYVSVLGNPFGMKIYTDGVLVIENTDITTSNGKHNPATDAGIKVGDYIKTVNGKTVTCNEDLLQLVTESEGADMHFVVVRGGKQFECDVTPIIDSQTGVYRIGIWVRDSSAGIGTLTFYSPANNIVCGLGHGVCDADTDTLLNIQQGELVEAEIVEVQKGSTGNPGALKGKLSYNTIAEISLNSQQGVYGFMRQTIDTENLTEIALKQDVHDGKAQILCTVDGGAPRLYSCEVKKTNKKNSPTQNMVVTVTDPELINATGGIVQGMSGSPIIQNGKLIGAVTHVLVDDPTRGYGIFAENMLETARSVERLKEAG
ncbi:MAG: SpoIVB peptidase [Clostridia bacterium]|nr:SpoIVB peptidase [Clostridia bacterium]